MTNEYGEKLDRNGYAPSILQSEYVQNECYLCGAIGDVARHEIYYGTANRENSKRYGCWVTLCPGCHDKIHRHEGEKELKQLAQNIAISHYGWTDRQFMHFFGKNWL